MRPIPHTGRGTNVPPSDRPPSDASPSGATGASLRAKVLCDHDLTRVLAFLARNVHRCVPLDELAALCRCCPTHFGRAFRGSMGVTPGTYHLHLRLIHAVRLLTDKPERTVAGVAQMCGFSDHAHLSRLMRRELGVRPSCVRRPSPPRVTSAASGLTPPASTGGDGAGCP